MKILEIFYYWILNHETEAVLDLRKKLYNIQSLKPILEWMAD